jgi:hypothetical protein
LAAPVVHPRQADGHGQDEHDHRDPRAGGPDLHADWRDQDLPALPEQQRGLRRQRASSTLRATMSTASGLPP